MSTDINTLSALAALLKKPTIENVWYHDKEIKLDGYRFVSCRFDNCKLYITTTNFDLVRCFIDANSVIIYDNIIAKPIRLFNRLNDWIYTNTPFFAPQRHEDGTISIAGD